VRVKAVGKAKLQNWGWNLCEEQFMWEYTCFALSFFHHPVWLFSSCLLMQIWNWGWNLCEDQFSPENQFCFHPDFWHKSKTEGETHVRTNSHEKTILFCALFFSLFSTLCTNFHPDFWFHLQFWHHFQQSFALVAWVASNIYTELYCEV